jgi:fructokinase
MASTENPMRIGIDLGGTKIEGVLLSALGETVTKRRVETPAGNYDATVAAVVDVISTLQAELPMPTTVGIGSPGALMHPEGIMKNCNSLCLNGQPLQRDLESRLGYAVRIENDANCFALSEAHFGAAKDASTVFGVILGTGTGGGIVINKQLLTGPNQIAGEWGHNPIPVSVRPLIDKDRICYCGRANCIETVLSGRGLKQTYHEQSGQTLEANAIAELARTGDPGAKECIEIYSQQLARCLASVINVIDPETIVLGGGLSNIDRLYETVPHSLEGFVFTEGVRTQLLRPTFGDASGAIGAACLWPAI